jgi:hypothetical protein
MIKFLNIKHEKGQTSTHLSNITIIRHYHEQYHNIFSKHDSMDVVAFVWLTTKMMARNFIKKKKDDGTQHMG